MGKSAFAFSPESTTQIQFGTGFTIPVGKYARFSASLISRNAAGNNSLRVNGTDIIKTHFTATRELAGYANGWAIAGDAFTWTTSVATGEGGISFSVYS